MAKSRNIIAIGGGGFGANPGQGIIEKYILKQTKRKNPKICFIPTATGDNEAYKVNFYTTFTNLDCHPSHLDFFKRTPNLNNLILNQDAIFVGGGNTKSMLAVWREWKLDKLLLKAYKKGKILCGVSAGAICWFEQGITDSWASNLNTLDCLGFIKGMACPHYQEESDRRPDLHKFLLDEKAISGHAIDGGAAAHFINGNFYKGVQFYSDSYVYKVTKKGKKVEEICLDMHVL